MYLFQGRMLLGSLQCVLGLDSQGSCQVLSLEHCRVLYSRRIKTERKGKSETSASSFPFIGSLSFLSAHRDYSSHGGWSTKPAASAGGRLNDL